MVGDFDCMLNQTNIGQNNNKFYVIQLLESRGQYYLWTRWGRVGEAGQSYNKRCGTQEAAEKEFCKKFRDKTKNSWEERESFTAVKGKYTLLEMDDEEGGEEVRRERGRGGEGEEREGEGVGEGEGEGEDDSVIVFLFPRSWWRNWLPWMTRMPRPLWYSHAR